MRKPLLMSALLAGALVVVLFAKFRLDKAIKEGTLPELGRKDEAFENSVDIGIEQDPKTLSKTDASHGSSGATKIDVMAALVEARQAFRKKDEVRNEASQDPHQTPPTIINAAEVLGNIFSLEKQNPAYKPEFQAFYLDCSKDAEVPTVTRVQCLVNYANSKTLTADEEEKLLSEVDPTVKQLYKEIKR